MKKHKTFISCIIVLEFEDSLRAKPQYTPTQLLSLGMQDIKNNLK